MPKACIVPKCKTGQRTHKVKCSVFRVPQNRRLRKQWEAKIPGIVFLKANQYVCEKHFSKECIIRKWIKHDSQGNIVAESPYQRPRLAESALPTIFKDESNANALVKTKKISSVDRMCVDNHSNSAPKIEENNHIEDSSPVHEIEQKPRLVRQILPQLDRDVPCIQSESIHKETSMVLNQIKIPVVIGRNKLLGSNCQAVDTNKEVTKSSIDNQQICWHLPTKPKSCQDSPTLPFRKTVISQQTHNSMNLSTSGFLKAITSTSLWINNDLLVKLPPMWCVTESCRGTERFWIFTDIRLMFNNDIRSPVIEKSVIIHADGTISYQVQGKAVEFHELQALRNTEDITLLPAILFKFQCTRVCKGTGPIVESLFQEGTAYRNNRGDWHSIHCELLTKKNRCEYCVRLKKTLLQKKARLEKRAEMKKIYRTSNSNDLKKLMVLKKTIYRLRQENNRAHYRILLLKNALKRTEINSEKNNADSGRRVK
ncbi:uncharacterized protein LOC107218079 isoform X1 [Neodiprion lecontei]|uniref:Uncharacterized protein LOC107218079 isoform X1 n=1 Tax=Neodiprion lecontei TaxID=441921 RepID=A0ABM3FQQ2_NEOLC|nr:uncharacterized protein LOC107218079 isoform X1 [Neodiprion lecontei]